MKRILLVYGLSLLFGAKEAAGELCLECPSKTVVRPGRTATLPHFATNHSDTAVATCYLIRDSEHWLLGSSCVELSPGARQEFSAALTVPDSADGVWNRVIVENHSGTSTCTYIVEVPELIAFTWAFVHPRQADITWAVGDSCADTATVFRRAAGGDWTERGQAFMDDGRKLTFQDKDVSAGSTYEYQLGLPFQQRLLYRGRVSVKIPASEPGPPARERLQLEAWPNPASKEMTLRFNVPAAAEVRFSLYDVAGRLWTRRAFPLTSGWYTYAVAIPHDLPPGLYILQGDQNHQTIRRRISIVR
ncbi:MAG: T9SS type A sorting domain-containing protein [Candidatus Kerfeldbacteria bacterium]|nr:T9SS type A sorting domain-containing protein [Candidatus Kerfeldbacteria bacterium]